jgi:hypothetical protein
MTCNCKLLEKRIEALENQILSLTGNKKLESFYQKQLESYFGGKHHNTPFGEIDILTPDSVIEIKHWPRYKEALGQIQAYSKSFPNHHQIVVFFGEYKNKDKVISLFSLNNIQVKEVSLDSDNQLIVTDLSKIESQDEFTKWLDENVVYKDDGILKLQDTVELFTGKKISSRLLGKFRKEIESYIKIKFPKNCSDYHQFWIGDKKYKGWKNVQIL